MTVLSRGKSPPVQRSKTAQDDFEVVQSKLCIGYRADIQPDSPMLNPMRMMTAILGGTPTSKLFLNVREKQSPLLLLWCQSGPDKRRDSD